MSFTLHGHGEVTVAVRLPKVMQHARGHVTVLTGAVVLAKSEAGVLTQRRVWRKFSDGTLRDAGA